MSLSPRITIDSNLSRNNAPKKKVKRDIEITGLVKPAEYARAVLGYSQLPTGAGQNHIPLGEFLTSAPVSITIEADLSSDSFVTEYVLDVADSTRKSSVHSVASPSDAHKSDVDPDSCDERPRDSKRITSFFDPKEFYEHTTSRSQPEGCIVFLRGFMSADWINHVGACHGVDPELFCRHLDFRPADDNSNNFSVPALPSSSWHLFELPVITIGTRIAQKQKVKLENVELLREEAAKNMQDHHHRICKLSSSGMAVGESLIRDLYVLDEIHFAIEQQVSVSLQYDKKNSSFSLLVWLDSGTDISQHPSLPWLTQRRDSHLLPTIQHRHMNALKCHLLNSPPAAGDPDCLTRKDQSAALLPQDYGRTLHPKVMSRDALYSLTEVLKFSASSQIQFCNLIDIKLNQYTSLPPAQDMRNLPNLKYLKQILYDHVQKTQRVLDSLENTKDSKWPKDRTNSASRKAVAASQSIEHDFRHILARLNTLHERATQGISTLMSSISITESQQAIEHARRVGKLTFLAFLFVPLSFTTSFFGMNVSELSKGQLGLQWWTLLSVVVAGGSLCVFFLDIESYFKPVLRVFQIWWEKLTFQIV